MNDRTSDNGVDSEKSPEQLGREMVDGLVKLHEDRQEAVRLAAGLAKTDRRVREHIIELARSLGLEAIQGNTHVAHIRQHDSGEDFVSLMPR